MTERSERREEIKLLLEYAKLIISLGVVGSLIFAGLQWRIAAEASDRATETAKLALYKDIANEWRDQLTLLFDNSAIRPYFEDGAPLEASSSQYNDVLAFADMRLDVMDGLLTYASMARWGDQFTGWEATFTGAFKNSPVLCQRLEETKGYYGLIVPLGASACR